MNGTMNYKCKGCGASLVIDEHTQKCPFCDLAICMENDLSGTLKRVEDTKIKNAEDLRSLVKAYQDTGDSKDIRTTVQGCDKYFFLPDFNGIWREFIINAAGVSVGKKDKDLQLFLKNHTREFDAKRENSQLYLSLLQAYPKLGTNNDWNELITHTHGDELQFGVLCESIIAYIVKNKDKAFAIDIFNVIKAQKEEWADAGRIYIRALLSSDEVATSVFPPSAFNRATKQFALELKAYSKKYLADNSIAVEQTKVWTNYTAAVAFQKRRNTIAAVSTAAVVVGAALGTFLILDAVNPNSVKITVDKVIEITYGDALPLDEYYVTYRKNSGEEIKTVLTEEMLYHYDAEAVGEQQTVYVRFSQTETAITIIVNPRRLETPQLTQSGNFVAWDIIPYAEAYSVYINATAVETDQISGISYDLSAETNYYGELSVTVCAVSNSDKYLSSAMSVPLVVTKLQTPQNITYANGKLIWNKVAGAVKYELSVNDTAYVTTEPECAVALKRGDINQIKIVAKGADATVVDGITSTELVYNRLDPIGAMAYQDDKITWTAGADAKSFAVYVDGEYWKDFSRTNFSVTADGFMERFGDGKHTIGIVCKSSLVGFESSEKKEFTVDIGNHITMDEGILRWNGVGVGATYFVNVNGTEYVFGDSYLSVEDCQWVEGENLVSVEANCNGEPYILETITLLKHKKPTVSWNENGLTTDGGQNDRYSVNDGAWTDVAPAFDALAAGDYTIKVKRVVSSNTALELESDTVAFTVKKAEKPVFTVEAGEIVCAFDAQKYDLHIEYTASGSEDWRTISSLAEIRLAGAYKLRVKLCAKQDAFAGYDYVVDSENSATIHVTKPAAPDVIYDKARGLVTSSVLGAKFYYQDENGEEHEVIGGDVGGLPSGVFSIYARLNATEENILDSENTPETGRAHVFNLSITFSINRVNPTSSLCYMVFDGCAEIDSLRYTYEINYYDANGNVIGGIDKKDTPRTAVKTNSQSSKIVDRVNFLGEGTYKDGYTFADVKRVEVIVYIEGDNSEEMQKSASMTI